MKIIINEGCIGCGLCEGACPDFFSINDDGKAQVDKQPDLRDLSQIQDVIELCPANVIELSKW